MLHNPKNLKRIMIIAFALVGIMLLASSCADVSHVQKCLPETEHTYGFWGGLWHGIIAPFAFIGELFSDDIAVYAKNNNGGWYDFGFLLGVGAFAGSGSLAYRSRS
jgi:hypothetical protein